MKNKTLHFGIFGAFLVIAALCVAIVGYKAHAAAPSAPTAKTVHAYIVKTHTGFVYKQTAITVSLKTAFDFTNNTAVSQTVTSNGQTVAIVAAHSSSPYTFAAVGTYTFGLASNTNATLTVTTK